MEERRGESISETMGKVGDEINVIFNSLGIDPDLTPQEKVTRAEEIRAGAELTNGERFKANAYHVIKTGNGADLFHFLLKFRLGQKVT